MNPCDADKCKVIPINEAICFIRFFINKLITFQEKLFGLLTSKLDTA